MDPITAVLLHISTFNATLSIALAALLLKTFWIHAKLERSDLFQTNKKAICVLTLFWKCIFEVEQFNFLDWTASFLLELKSDQNFVVLHLFSSVLPIWIHPLYPDLDSPSISRFGPHLTIRPLYPRQIGTQGPTSCCSDRDLIFWRSCWGCWTSFVPFLSISTIRISGRFRSIWQIKPSSTSSFSFKNVTEKNTFKVDHLLAMKLNYPVNKGWLENYFLRSINGTLTIFTWNQITL